MRKPAGEIAFLIWINDHQVISLRIILMMLQIDVIKLWDVIFQFFLFHDLFYEVLSLVPSPWLIELPIILHDEISLLNTLFLDTSGSFTFSMDSKGSLIDILKTISVFVQENVCIKHIFQSK